jgi:hypothetical protein
MANRIILGGFSRPRYIKRKTMRDEDTLQALVDGQNIASRGSYIGLIFRCFNHCFPIILTVTEMISRYEAINLIKYFNFNPSYNDSLPIFAGNAQKSANICFRPKADASKKVFP